MIEQQPASTDTAVLYNASCPVCSSEIAHYESYARKRDLPLKFEDLGDTDLTAWGLTADQAARRLHVLQGGRFYPACLRSGFCGRRCRDIGGWRV